jgi:hypothetical protein
MNTLQELKAKFLDLGLELQYEGWIIRVGDDRWTMLDSHLYRNGEPFAEKELPAYLKGLKANPPKLRKRKPKKITANRGYEHDGQGNQVD